MDGSGEASGPSPYTTFAEIISRFHGQYAEAGPSSTAAQLDSPIRYDVVLDEDGGMIETLMGSLEN